MGSYMFPFIVRDGLLCLTYLTGIVAGVLAIMRKQTKIGGYVLAAFILLALEPIVDFVIFNFLSPQFGESMGYEVYNWAYSCISSLANILGVILLMAAVYFSLQSQLYAKNEGVNPSEEVIFNNNKES